MMHRRDSINCFYFQNQFTRDQHIQTITYVRQLDILIHKRQRDLVKERQPSCQEFLAETRLICTFQQTRPKFRVNRESCIQHTPGECI